MFFGRLPGYVVGIGTLSAMVYVGLVVKFLNPHLEWFDRILCYVPGAFCDICSRAAFALVLKDVC